MPATPIACIRSLLRRASRRSPSNGTRHQPIFPRHTERPRRSSPLSPATAGLATGTFLASAVECVEAFTIVLAMGLTRSWRAAILGAIAALVALAALTAIAGLALVSWVSE